MNSALQFLSRLALGTCLVAFANLSIYAQDPADAVVKIVSIAPKDGNSAYVRLYGESTDKLAQQGMFLKVGDGYSVRQGGLLRVRWLAKRTSVDYPQGDYWILKPGEPPPGGLPNVIAISVSSTGGTPTHRDVQALIAAWRSEADPAEKWEIALETVARFPSTSEAELLAYEGLFKSSPAEHKLEMALVYVERQGATATPSGKYYEDALAFIVARQDPSRLRYAEKYLALYPSGRYKTYVQREFDTARFGQFTSLLNSGDRDAAIKLADVFIKDGRWEIYYASAISQVTTATILKNNGSDPKLVEQSRAWTIRAIDYLNSGKQPEPETDASSWAAKKPLLFAALYRNEGTAEFYRARANTSSYRAAIDLFKKSISYGGQDTSTLSLLFSGYEAELSSLLQQYGALSAAAKQSEAGVNLKSQILSVDADRNAILTSFQADPDVKAYFNREKTRIDAQQFTLEINAMRNETLRGPHN